jgi:predicted short-subunit dehydrogenase-like oxidoreductase (DUF2520 family)
MIKTVVLGSGNVGSHLIKVFLSNSNIELLQVFNRDLNKIKSLQKNVLITNDLSKIVDADIYIIAISDDAIHEFSKSLRLNNKLIVHTSGSVSLDAIENKRRGVFYPLQSFSAHKEVYFKKIPICLETKEEKDLALLENLATLISNHVYKIDSNQRKKLHLAAVFVNNFVNHLYEIGHQICTDNQVPFEILLPLIKETSEKITTYNPKEVQTGPAKRNDQITIKNQLDQLNPDHKKIYALLTESILKTHTTHGN